MSIRCVAVVLPRLRPSIELFARRQHNTKKLTTLKKTPPLLRAMQVCCLRFEWRAHRLVFGRVFPTQSTHTEPMQAGQAPAAPYR
jgi:hypothetical protein